MSGACRSQSQVWFCCAACVQASLTGSGAKVAIICNVTPASSQSDETWNTLRFADGAKRIKVGAEPLQISVDGAWCAWLIGLSVEQHVAMPCGVYRLLLQNSRQPT